MARMNFAALLVFLTSVYGSVTIPKDLPNGVYAVSYDQKGNAVHTKIARAEGAGENTLGEVGVLGKRDQGVFCAEAVLPSNNVLQAQNALSLACDQGGESFVPPWDSQSKERPGVRYSKFDSAVAYVCNYSRNSQHCASGEISSDFTAIGNLCGLVAGRYSHYDTWRKNYGYDDSSVSFC